MLNTASVFGTLVLLRGFANKHKFQKSEITMEVGGGGGGVQVSIGIFFGKSSQYSYKPELIFLSSITCVFCLYTLLKSCWLL